MSGADPSPGHDCCKTLTGGLEVGGKTTERQDSLTKEVMVDTQLTPMWCSIAEITGTTKGTSAKTVTEFFNSMQERGAFVVVQIGSAKGQPRTHTWLFDSEALISQISN